MNPFYRVIQLTPMEAKGLEQTLRWYFLCCQRLQTPKFDFSNLAKNVARAALIFTGFAVSSPGELNSTQRE
tara:strand:- start:213 stop:425 length:213 start_codon:yes stop_codon:yes gene_type:complete